jgi:polar amino acid transport system substrate-binding protein
VAEEQDGSGPWSPRAQARAATVVGSLERVRPDTFAHARRVAQLAVRVARHAHLPEPLVSQIYWGALVHDVGELNVEPALLRRGSSIDERERIAICDHTIVGARWLAGVPELAPLVPFARWHHERFDGLGYPDGATAGQVPLAVALVGVCDAWDALTEPRPYREPLSVDDAATEMWRHAGHQWSRALVTWTVDCAQRHECASVAELGDDGEMV